MVAPRARDVNTDADMNRQFEAYRAESASEKDIEKAIRQSIQALIDEIARDKDSQEKLASILGKDKQEPSSKQMPLLSEQKGVTKDENGLGIEITSPAIKEAFIGPDGRSLSEDLFTVLAGTEAEITSADSGKSLSSIAGIKEVRSVTIGGGKIKTGFDELILTRTGTPESPESIEELTFAKHDTEHMIDPKRSITIKIQRSQSLTNGLPESKVSLVLGLEEGNNSITDNIGNLPDRLGQIQFILDYKPNLSNAERDQLSAEAATLRSETVKGLDKESQQANQAALMKDLASLIAIARERGHTVMAQSSAGAAVDSPESRQLRALDVFSRIIETPGSFINRTKKAERADAKSGKQEKPSTAPQLPDDIQAFINKMTGKQEGQKSEPNRKLDRDGLPLPTRDAAQEVKVVSAEQAKPKVEKPKTPEELKTQFEAELTAIKDLRKKKEDIEAQIKALGTAEVGTLSDADKKKLDTLQKQLAEAKQGLEVLQALGDLQLHDRKRGALEKGKAALKGKFKNEIDPESVMTVEQLSRLSVSDLLAILKLNAEYAGERATKGGDVVKEKAKFDQINILVVIITQFSTENEKAAKDSRGKESPKAVTLLTEWLTARNARLTNEISALNATGTSAESTNKERDEKLALLRKELAQVESDLGAANLRAANILRGMGDQVPMDEWMKMSSALHEASFGDLPEVPNPAEAAAKTEAAANASIAANCLRHINLELEQRLEPETSKVKKFFKRAAEVLTSVFGGIAARTAVKAVVTGALGLALGGPAGLLVGGLAGALAGGASSAIFSTYMHYKVFNNDKMHALYAENANPGKYDFFKGKIFDKANETYGVKARVQNIATVYNAMLSGQLQPGQITPEQAQTLLAVVKDSKVLKNTTNFIGVNNLGLDAALFKNAAGETVLPEDALRDFALKFDNFVNAAINAGKLNTVDVAASLKKADDESKVMVDAMIASASWTKFFKGALIGGASGLIAQGIGNALEGHGFFGTATDGSVGSHAEGVVASQPNMSEEEVLKLNEEAIKRIAPYGQQQYEYLHQTYSNVPEADLKGMFTSFDANGNGIIDGPEMKIFAEALNNSNTGTGVSGSIVGAWDAPVDGNISKDVPQEWVDTWSKGISSVGRGHDFHGAAFSMQGTPGGHQYALGRALDYMSKNVPAENMNTPEAGISVSHLYGHLLLGGQPTDAELADFLTRVDAKYDGAGYDVSRIFSGSVGTAATSGVDSATVIAGLDQINGAAYNELTGLWTTMAETAQDGSVAQTVAGSVGNFIVDSTRSISELGTSGALAGMGVSMWLANMYTPENREYAKPKTEEANTQQNQGNGGTPPTPGTGTPPQTSTPTNTPPQNSNTPPAQPVAANNANTNPVNNNQNPVPGAAANSQQNSNAPANQPVANSNINPIPNNVNANNLSAQADNLQHLNQEGRWVPARLPNQIIGTPINTADVAKIVANQWDFIDVYNWELTYPGNGNLQRRAYEELATLMAAAYDVKLADQLYVTVGDIKVPIDQALKDQKLVETKDAVAKDIDAKMLGLGQTMDVVFANVLSDLQQNDNLKVLSQFEHNNELASRLRTHDTVIPVEVMDMTVKLTMALRESPQAATRLLNEMMARASDINKKSQGIGSIFNRRETYTNIKGSFATRDSRFIPTDKLLVYAAAEVAARAAKVRYVQNADGLITGIVPDTDHATNISQVLTTLANTQKLLLDSPVTEALARIMSLNETPQADNQDTNAPQPQTLGFERQTKQPDTSFFMPGTLQRVDLDAPNTKPSFTVRDIKNVRSTI